MKLAYLTTCLLFGVVATITIGDSDEERVTNTPEFSNVAPMEIISERRTLDLIVQKIRITNQSSIENLDAFNNKTIPDEADNK